MGSTSTTATKRGRLSTLTPLPPLCPPLETRRTPAELPSACPNHPSPHARGAAGDGAGAEQCPAAEPVDLVSGHVAVLDPVEDRAVHEPHPRTDGGAELGHRRGIG